MVLDQQITCHTSQVKEDKIRQTLAAGVQAQRKEQYLFQGVELSQMLQYTDKMEGVDLVTVSRKQQEHVHIVLEVNRGKELANLDYTVEPPARA